MKEFLEHVPLQPDLAVVATLMLSAIAGLLVYRVVENPLLVIGQRSIRKWAVRHIAA